jgi:hypothetical protein
MTPIAARTLEYLDAIMPFAILNLSPLTDEQRITAAQEAWGPVIDCDGKGKTQLTGGAALMFGGPTYHDERKRLVTALAAMAYQPGGITWMGRHWCTDHQLCLNAKREAVESPLETVDPPPTEPDYRGRPVVDLHLPEVA